MDLQFRLLGAVQLHVGGITVTLPATKPSTVLAALLLRANMPVTTQRLYEAVWDDSPPKSARATLQTNVLRLRQLLADHHLPTDLIRTVPGGYQFEATSKSLDLLKFRQLTAMGRAHAEEDDVVGELRCLEEANSLWRGTPLVNIESETLHRDEVPQLYEEWLEAASRRFDILLQLQRYRGMIQELRSLTAAHPHRERLWEQMIVALHRSGRQAEALEEYRKVKRLLLDELGVDPGLGLQQLELSILAGDPGAIVRVPVATAPINGPCGLPLAVANFVGRDDLVQRLARALTQDDGVGPVIVGVRGSPGIGKTALALRVAHEVRHAFPDGQWYVDMTIGDGTPRRTEDALAQLLQTAGVPAASIPSGLSARAAAFRAAVADRRTLLLLDDVVSAGQAHPLLPGTPGNAVLLTSRDSLLGLSALFGLRSHLLEALAPGECVELLDRIRGTRLVGEEREAALELAGLCGHLPLALRIAAAGAASRHWELSRYVSWLRTDTLAKLAIPSHRPASVVQTFEVSYSRLTLGAKHVLRAIGNLGLLEFTLPELVPHCGEVVGDPLELLEELLQASLLGHAAPGKFTVPRLLSQFALR